MPKHVQPYFVKMICLSGTESTGKTTLARQLAQHFNTSFVPEMARTIIAETQQVTRSDLTRIAGLHAQKILENRQTANKILICDTDLNITKSYCKFLFNEELKVDQWIEDANHFNLHIFLENDCPFVQDGTRLDEAERNKLSRYHLQQLDDNNIMYEVVKGDWKNRFLKSCKLIEQYFFG